jgi:cytosine/adenosine deaminase-related metal-dependent hydrolase
VLSARFVGAHGVWLEDEELARSRARRGAGALPGSNLKLGRASPTCVAGAGGRALRHRLDGAACNNRLDTFHEMSSAAGIGARSTRAAACGARRARARALRRRRARAWASASGSLEPASRRT